MKMFDKLKILHISVQLTWSSLKIVRIVLPFKDQDSADLVRKQLKDLSLKTHTVIQLVFVSDECMRLNRLLLTNKV